MTARPFRRPAAALLCAVLMLATAAAGARDKLVLVRPADKESGYARRLFQLVASDAFGKLGYDVEIRNYPPLRASREANAGNVDGEAGRTRHYGDAHPALVRADEVIVVMRIAAFTTDPDLRLDGWDSLKDRPYRIAYRSGYELTKARLERTVPAVRLTDVADGQTGMQRLALGIIDLYIDTSEFGQLMMDKMPERYSKVRVAGWMEQLPLYFYLHRRHAALVPRLTAMLHQMRADGTLDRYVEQALLESDSPSVR
jgi:ABC-type amino acid transport substrate-binding protein